MKKEIGLQTKQFLSTFLLGKFFLIEWIDTSIGFVINPLPIR